VGGLAASKVIPALSSSSRVLISFFKAETKALHFIGPNDAISLKEQSADIRVMLFSGALYF